jgi:hypothetical protein
MHSMRHMKKIERILEGCGLPGERFRNQSQFISAMLMPSEEPLAGCIGQQYSPPPAHDFPMLILATSTRIVALLSNTDVEANLPTPLSTHAYNRIDEIAFYEGDRADGEFRIRYKGNRRVVTYKNVVSFLQPMMDEVSQLNFGIDIHRTPVPMAEVYSLKERISHKALRWRRAAGRFVASPTLTTVLNILLAIAVIAQAVALILR